MCGICGFTGTPEREVLLRMTTAIRHRGPDDTGTRQDAEVSLGMRRLSIVDLATGHQPVPNEDESIWVVFNGEIYNHLELRKDLEARGHHFRTNHSDTEVLVHLYEEHGPEYLTHLNGMFAIALWDSRAQELHLARDRAGIKPLYFTHASGRWLFASEIKSLLAHPDVSRQPNFSALHHYFSLKNIPAPYSAFAGVEQLRAGERAVVREGTLTRHRWWRLQFREDQTIGEDEAAARIRALLTDSVRLQMGADVEFGAFLSGGVDSSSVVALMAELGAHRVKTFSLAYEEDFRNKTRDRELASAVSRQYGTEHREYVMAHGDLLESIDSVVAAFDEPFSGVTSTYFLTQLIAQHVKVALSGDGADELFASYLPHRLAQPLHTYAQLNRPPQAGLDETQREELKPFDQQTEMLAQLLDRGDEASRRMAQYLWTECGKQQLYSSAMKAAVADASTEALVRQLYQESGTEDPLNRALFVDFESLLPDQVLAFVDRLSMAHSLEVRPPFLDHRLMEFAATLPGRLKIRAGRVKHVLKEAVRGLIPDEIIDRPKEGFVLPVNEWLDTYLSAYVRQVLTPERLATHGLLATGAVLELLQDHYERGRPHGARIWNLLMFQLWWEQFFA